MRKFNLSMLAFVALQGCATAPNQDELRLALQPVICDNKSQCDLYWQRTQAWIARASAWRIQLATDVLIQTYGPGGRSVNLAYAALRENNPNGSAAIRFRVQCDNLFRCHPPVVDAVARMKQYIQDGN